MVINGDNSMFEVWFGMSPITGDDRMCQVPGYGAALNVYDALCAKYVCVILYDEAGQIVRSYDNR
jgi:hypothetical protein